MCLKISWKYDAFFLYCCMSWYEEYIEEPIRDLVKHLRSNGFNTFCSCGHKMYVQCEYIPDGEIGRLHHLLFNYFFENNKPINYTITVSHQVIDGHSYSSIHIDFKDKSL